MRARFVVALAALVLGSCAVVSGGQTDLMSCADQLPPADLTPPQARLVQQSLSQAGNAVRTSDSFDRQTHSALLSFQRARGLAPTGELTAQTVSALGIDSCAVVPHPEFVDRDPTTHTSYYSW